MTPNPIRDAMQMLREIPSEAFNLGFEVGRNAPLKQNPAWARLLDIERDTKAAARALELIITDPPAELVDQLAQSSYLRGSKLARLEPRTWGSLREATREMWREHTRGLLMALGEKQP